MAHPPQGTWTNEEIQFDRPKCIKECTKYETSQYWLTYDESVATDPDARVIGYVSAAEDDQLKRVPMEFRQYLGCPVLIW